MVKKSQNGNSNRLSTVIFFLIASLSFTAVSFTLSSINYAVQADEGYYYKYADFISEGGLSGLKNLFANYINNRINWLFPNPLRIGYIVLSAVFFKIFGSSFFSLTLLSLFSFYAFLYLSFYYGRKFFAEKTALLFTALLSFSPINLAMARRALLESTALLLLMLAVWLFFDLIGNKRSNFKYFLFAAVYSFAILVKETSVLIAAFFIIFLLYRSVFLKKPVYYKDYFAILLALLIAASAYLLFAGASFSLQVIKIITQSPKTNQYALLFGSGPWFRYIIDYLLVSPWTIILAIGFIFHFLVSKEEENEQSQYLLLFFILNLLIFNMFTKNLRYMIQLDTPIRLFSVMALMRLAKRISSRYFVLIASVIIIAVCLSDYFNFYQLFQQKDIYDPITFLMLGMKQIIPIR